MARNRWRQRRAVCSFNKIDQHELLYLFRNGNKLFDTKRICANLPAPLTALILVNLPIENGQILARVT